jgi:hypothetical protein
MHSCSGLMALLVTCVLGVGCAGGQFTSGSPAVGGDSGQNGPATPSAGASGSSAVAPSAGVAGVSAAGSGGATAGDSAAAGSGGATASGGAPANGGNGGSMASAGAAGIDLGTVGGGMGTSGAANSSCPVPVGYYKMITIDGAGCGDLDPSVPACVAAGGAVCRYDVESRSGKSVSGSISVQPDGTFQNAAIQDGSAQRSGCQGTVTKGVLTIVCGGTDPSSDQYCAATLTRSALLCP